MLFTVRKSKVTGFRVKADGSVEDFETIIDRHYSDLVRATNSVRRLLRDNLITVTDVEKLPVERYYVDDATFYEVAERIK